MPSRSSSASSAASRFAPTQPASKAAPAAPVLDRNEVEMGTISGSKSNGRVEDKSVDDAGGDAGRSHGGDSTNDIMHLARIGDIAGMERLLESGAFEASYSDSEGITPLHWAAINNQYAMCQFLLDQGAAVDAIGGTSLATPLQWAAQRSHYYTANLLLRRGADPVINDGQGYNALHIATFEGNVLLIILLLHQGIPVDVTDQYGHTGLMWSAYKGFPHLVDIFLRWGADVHAVDDLGFTALHWALVRGNFSCVHKLVEYGADRFAKTGQDKTPAMMAEEHNSLRAWKRALAECGYDEDGQPVEPTLPGMSWLLQDSRVRMLRFFFLTPFVMVWLAIISVSYLPIFVGLPLAVAISYGTMQLAQRMMEFAPADMRRLHKTPWMAGIFAACLALVGLNWLVFILPETMKNVSNPVFGSNLLFVVLYGLVVFYYTSTMRADPGFVPRLNGVAEQKAVIDELISLWKFDENNFCVPCMIRTPLRSKHCKQCHRCVARHDHHCPWVFNCIGVNNHRHFFFYIIYLCAGILSYDWLLYNYFRDISPAASDVCNLLAASLCRLVNSDPYTLVLGIITSAQLTWVTMLLFVQTIQLSRGMTTYENMHGVVDVTAAVVFSSTGIPLDPNRTINAPALSRHGQHQHRHKHGWMRNMLRLLGVEPFVETVRGTGAATQKQQQRKNPFSRGIMANCRDFWCDPAPMFGTRENGAAMLGGDKVNYTDMYESPTIMGIGRRRGGYEVVGGEEV